MILKDLLVETRTGQRAELWQRTSRVLNDWQCTRIPGYESRETSLDDLVSESESELGQRERRLKKHSGAKPRKGKGRDNESTSRSPSKQAVGVVN